MKFYLAVQILLLISMTFITYIGCAAQKPEIVSEEGNLILQVREGRKAGYKYGAMDTVWFDEMYGKIAKMEGEVQKISNDASIEKQKTQSVTSTLTDSINELRSLVAAAATKTETANLNSALEQRITKLIGDRETASAQTAL
eukprot:UC1_evm1s656